MSPTIKSYTISSHKTYLAAILLCASAFWNCGTESSEDNAIATEFSAAKVSLKLDYPETPLVDSLVLDCYGADTIHLVQDADNRFFSMDLFPSDHWNFQAKIYANGALMQMGELETKLEAGSVVNLNIQMHAIVGFVYIDIPLGLNNKSGVKSGKMTLQSDTDFYEINMEQTMTAGIFKSEMLKLGTNYDVEIILSDADGKEIYKLTDKFLLSENSPIPNLTLNSLRSQVALAISLAPEQNLELTLPLPAGYRKPQSDDILITEVFSAPDPKDTTQYEFVELYNGSLDTLNLEDCTIGLTSSSSTKFFSITTNEIPPNQILVLGSPNSANTPAKFVSTDGWNDLGNSKGTIILKCDNTTLDSLYYAPEIDSIHTNVVPGIASSKYGQSSQLILERWQSRQDSSAWSLTTPTPGMI